MGWLKAGWAIGTALFMIAAGPAGADSSLGMPGRFQAGSFSFSDELGGFHLLSAEGSGTRSDPFVIRQELVSASPVTLVIRLTQPVRPFDFASPESNGFSYFEMLVLNNSGHPWLEFEFELQEILSKASMFGDGLSFDQRKAESELISSDRFANYRRDFEPYDRLRFHDGKVDPMETVAFSFLITDFTPRSQFYLVLDPRIPSF